MVRKRWLHRVCWGSTSEVVTLLERGAGGAAVGVGDRPTSILLPGRGLRRAVVGVGEGVSAVCRA